MRLDSKFLAEISKHCAYQKALAFDLPYEYKGIMLYPVGLEYLMEFYTCIEVLKVKQERTKDKKLIKLPYLWFLRYAFENHARYNKPEYGLFIPFLFALLEMVTKSSNIDMKVERKENGDYRRCFLLIDGIELNNKDFMELRQIIFAQAGIEHSDEFIHEDAEKAMIEGRLYEQKKSGYVSPTLENLVDILAVYLHKSVSEIVNTFTIRKFNNILRYIATFEEWKLLKGGELSGMVTFKKPIPHWIGGFVKKDVFDGENTDYRQSNLMKI